MGHIDHFEDILINVFNMINAMVLGVIKDLVHLKNP